MRSSIATVKLLIAGLLSAALLCACGSNPTATTPQLSSLDVRSALKVQPAGGNFGKWVYTAQLYDHDLKIYEKNGDSLTYFGTIYGLAAPAGTQTTPNGWWYVAESGASKIDIYKSKKSGPVGPFPPLTDYGQVPVNVAAVPNRRLVAVSNQMTAGSGAGSVSVYLNRQTDPSRTLTYGASSAVGMGVAITHQGDCYWSFNATGSGPGTIVKFAGCSGSGTQVVTNIARVGGIAFDQSDNLYYIDQTYGIYKCQKTANCKQFATVDGWQPVNMNFDHKAKDLWVADATGYIVEITGLNNPKKKMHVIRTPAEGGSSDPPYGIAPAPGQ
jgi:hypothetical protein